MGRYGECVTWAERALSLQPDRVPTYYVLAEAEERLGGRERARATLERLLAIAPGEERARSILAAWGAGMGDAAG
jgi:tetratricopeptide (TPR) repeat protein